MHTEAHTFHTSCFRTVLSDMEQCSEHFVNGVCLGLLHTNHDRAAFTLSCPLPTDFLCRLFSLCNWCKLKVEILSIYRFTQSHLISGWCNDLCSNRRQGHINYRDSKLTRLLQPALGGNARTAIICTLSPARSHVEQTRNTLLFACCAKEVATKAQVNVVMSDKALVKHLQKEVARLESELRSPDLASSTCDYTSLLRQKDLQIQKVIICFLNFFLQNALPMRKMNKKLIATKVFGH